jgi:hypothetical protein
MATLDLIIRVDGVLKKVLQTRNLPDEDVIEFLETVNDLVGQAENDVVCEELDSDPGETHYHG